MTQTKDIQAGERTQLSYDGKGINGPDEFRSRIATFANNDAAYEYGTLFAAAPIMLKALKDVRDSYQQMFDSMPVAFQTYDHIVNEAIEAAQGR